MELTGWRVGRGRHSVLPDRPFERAAKSPGYIRGPAHCHAGNAVFTELGDGFDLGIKALLRIVIGSCHRISDILNRK